MSRRDIETSRLLVYAAAELMDLHGNKHQSTRQYLALVKAHVPLCIERVLDRCIQVVVVASPVEVAVPEPSPDSAIT